MSNDSLSRIFLFQNRLALIGWLVLMFAVPFWSQATAVVSLVVIALCASYVYLLVLGKKYDDPEQPLKGNFFTFKGVRRLFQHPRSTLVGWIHFLAFDLMIGLFIVSDAGRYDISHWMLIPVLIATLMFGPSGLLLYFVLRLFYSGFSIDLGF